MTRLLCLLLGHVRWQRDGRESGPDLMLVRRWAGALGPVIHGRRYDARWHYLDPDWAVFEVQHYLPFTRSWLCFRCHRWQDEPDDISRLVRRQADRARQEMIDSLGRPMFEMARIVNDRADELREQRESHIDRMRELLKRPGTKFYGGKSITVPISFSPELNDFGDHDGIFHRALYRDPRFKPEGYGPNDPLPGPDWP